MLTLRIFSLIGRSRGFAAARHSPSTDADESGGELLTSASQRAEGTCPVPHASSGSNVGGGYYGIGPARQEGIKILVTGACGQVGTEL
eukprot:scaffold177824_cov14-Tisochrysis_lutea.AAC.1